MLTRARSHPSISAQAAEELLATLAPERVNRTVAEKVSTEAPTSTVSWGEVSVGPILRPRLLAAGISKPTPIQIAAFNPVSRGDAALIVSETGTGKTLAFLVQLRATQGSLLSLTVPDRFDTISEQKREERKPTRPLTASECPLLVETVCGPGAAPCALPQRQALPGAFGLPESRGGPADAKGR